MDRELEQRFVAKSGKMQELYRQILTVAPTASTVLVTGETGSGKSLVARKIHFWSNRSGKPLYSINCLVGSESGLELEVSDYVSGQTAADKKGAPGITNGATVFLDRIGEMDSGRQTRLLRFLERVETQNARGSGASQNADVRVIAATNKNLLELVNQGSFQADIFYRINVINIQVPPLREHKEDIPELVRGFLQIYAAGNGNSPKQVSNEAMRLLIGYDWPGNVRELENYLKRAFVLGKSQTIGTSDLPPEIMDRTAHSQGYGGVRTERRRTVADILYLQMTKDGKGFFDIVYPVYMGRDITRENLRQLIKKGLEETSGSYRRVTRLFNIPETDYKRFLNFLRKHDCQLPFRDYR